MIKRPKPKRLTPAELQRCESLRQNLLACLRSRDIQALEAHLAAERSLVGRAPRKTINSTDYSPVHGKTVCAIDLAVQDCDTRCVDLLLRFGAEPDAAVLAILDELQEDVDEEHRPTYDALRTACNNWTSARTSMPPPPPIVPPVVEKETRSPGPPHLSDIRESLNSRSVTLRLVLRVLVTGATESLLKFGSRASPSQMLLQDRLGKVVPAFSATTASAPLRQGSFVSAECTPCWYSRDDKRFLYFIAKTIEEIQ